MPSEIGPRLAAAEKGRYVAWVQTDRPVIVGNGLLVAAQLGQGLAALEIEQWVIGGEADRLSAVGYYLLVTLLGSIILSGTCVAIRTRW